MGPPPKPAGLSGYSQRVVTINDFGLQERTRTSKTGKESVRFTVGISGSPLPHNLDPAMLGRKPAEAMADWLRNRVKTIQASVAPTTERRRKEAELAFSRGFPEAVKRYAGGRMGAMAPNTQTGDRLFNDSGRFAAGISAMNPKAGAGALGGVGPSNRVGSPAEWVINVPANRLDPTTLTGPEGRSGLAALQQIYAKLVELVPEFGDANMLVNVPSVRRAIEESAKQIIRQDGNLRGQLQAERLRTLRTILDTWGKLGDIGESRGDGIGGLFL